MAIGPIGYDPHHQNPFDLDIKIKKPKEDEDKVPADTGTVSCQTCGCSISANGCASCGCSGGSCPSCNTACYC